MYSPPSTPPAFVTPVDPVNSPAASKIKVIIRKKKTPESARDDL